MGGRSGGGGGLRGEAHGAEGTAGGRPEVQAEPLLALSAGINFAGAANFPQRLNKLIIKTETESRRTTGRRPGAGSPRGATG